MLSWLRHTVMRSNHSWLFSPQLPEKITQVLFPRTRDGSCHLTWNFTNSSPSTSSPCLLFVAGILPFCPCTSLFLVLSKPNPFSLPLHPSFTIKVIHPFLFLSALIPFKASAFIPYVIYQCFLKGSGFRFDCSCIKNTQAYCCQLHPLLFIRFDRCGYLKPPCFIQLMASQQISGKLSLNLALPDFLIRIWKSGSSAGNYADFCIVFPVMVTHHVMCNMQWP